ncbi:MAG TPA: DUF6159 family protein [Dehalococcoidia bacterium]|nr:DUF6159 family protein [Dehalococcoidia bacterium]
MLGTLGNSFKLLSISWRVLRSDRELILFPLMAGGSLFFVFVYTAAAFWAGGTFDRIGPDYRFYLADWVFLGLAYFTASFVVIYFNAALVAAAYQRLEGWNPDVRTGLNAANDRLGVIFGWSAMAATVALVLDELSDNDSLIGKLFGFALKLIWGYATFFVVPVLVIEGASPMDALGRSTDLFRQHWGRAMVANFGFGVGYILVALIALGPAAGLYFGLGAQVLGVIVGGLLFTLGVAVVKSLETIFVTALYDYAATGRIGGDYNEQMIHGAYVQKNQRGGWSKRYTSPHRASW